MPSTRFFGPIGGLASIGAGFLLACAHTIHLLSGVDEGTVLGKSLVLFAHLGLTFALIGLYEAQGKANGLLGFFGMVFGIMGTTLATAIVFVELAIASGMSMTPIFEEGVTGVISMFGPLCFVVGMVLVGVSVMKEAILPKIAGLCLVVGTVIFSLGSMVPSVEGMMTVIGGLITGLGFVWLGLSLLSSSETENKLLQQKLDQLI